MSNALLSDIEANRRALRIHELVESGRFRVETYPVRLRELPEDNANGIWVERQSYEKRGFFSFSYAVPQFEYHFIPNLELAPRAYRAGRAARSLFSVRGVLALAALAYGIKLAAQGIETYRAMVAA